MPYLLSENKITMHPDGYKVSATDPKNYLTYDRALAAQLATGYKISRVCVGDGVWFHDLDHCIDSNSGSISQVAAKLMEKALSYSVYIERSSSGSGLHVWGKSKRELPEHACKNTELEIELYTNNRHGVLTKAIPSSPLKCITDVDNAECSGELLEWLVEEYFKPKASTEGVKWDGEDNGIDWSKIKRRKTSDTSNPFTGAKSLLGLLKMDRLEWETSDKSGVDMTLLNHLAFNTGRNHAAMKRLYLESNIGKYRSDEIPCKIFQGRGQDSDGNKITYLDRSIIKAVNDCEQVYKTPSEIKQELQEERIKEIRATVEGDRGDPDSPAGFYLRDFVCIYNGESPSYVDARTGVELGKSSFKECFRIDSFEFEQAFPERILADREYCPGKPFVVERDGLRILNTYRSGPKPRAPEPENKKLLDDYFNAIVPDVTERNWLLQWCGHIVQKVDVKILNAVILCGADNGTGKSTLSVLLSKAVGAHNRALLNNDTLNDKYNSWLSSNIIAISEELSVGNPQGERAKRIKDSVKDWVTTRESPIRDMHKSWGNKRNTVNGFLFTTNNIDSMPIDPEDRRFFVVEVFMNFMIQNLIKSGGYTRLNGELPDAEIAGYFHNVNLDGFNPNGFAPETQVKRDMIELTESDIMSTIKELIADPDYSGARVDVAYNTIIARDISKPIRQVNKTIRSLGYRKYPGRPYSLKNGELPSGVTHSMIYDQYQLLKKGAI